MRGFCRRTKKVFVLVFIVLFVVWLFVTIIEFSFGLTVTTDDLIATGKTLRNGRQLKAFITSSYYYPISKSLGDNALALVLSINLVRNPANQLEHILSPDPSELIIMAQNASSSVIVSAPYVRVTPHEVCQVITIFATVQLISNVKSISMLGDNGMAEIPFTMPSYTKRDVVVCTSPLFVSEQWQNFLLAVHIYRKFGAHMNLYLISSVTSFYELMKEYEREGYMTVQPWVKVDFPGVPKTTADPFNQIEFRNQAASQTDCLLQFKESARFVTFLDLDDVLIPKIAPTYAEEFQKLMDGKKKLAYIFYHKENYDAVVARDSSRFSLKKMFGSLECKHNRETGKIVVDPRNLNYTWIHFPPILPNGLEKYEVTENVITHLKTIVWTDDQEQSRRILIEPLYFDNSTAKIISSKDILSIEKDLRRMIRKPRIRKIFAKLPNIHYFTDLVVKCYNDRYYRYHYSGRLGDIKCPGPQLCGFIQHPKIKCTHVTATHIPMETLYPITYYYATDAYFTSDIGCYAH
ncbi:hypothetical protein L5515_007444 [Caenorhabditis briggsae]|uniref:Glycosyltransferase family 92 protein n=1 Tax=Caenorhabditis briggsae TaxID=6238 RepID=A0AAE9EYF1_CAEBR|nr:hypothetical protein L5515_007444 [Caenorhabditis briggsae]